MIPLVPLGKASMALYPGFARKVEERSGMQVGYRAKGTIGAILSAHAREELSTIIALHHGLGLAADALSAEEARALEPALSEEIEAAVLRPEEASVDNRALTRAVQEAAKRSGVEFFPGRGVDAMWTEGSRCFGLIVMGEKVAAGHTVIAAGSFCGNIEGVAHLAPVRPAKGQMIALRCEQARLERVLWSEEIYLVPRNDGRILAGATVEHIGFDKTVTAGGMKKLLKAAIELAPVLENARIEETWAGLRPDTPDHLPILGPGDVDGLLLATGHFRSGVMLAPLTAKLIREWVTNKDFSADLSRFSPLRFQNPAASGTSSARSSN